ncbi:2'-5' RNA ligase family protein [Algoriphagus namhaensis]
MRKMEKYFLAILPPEQLLTRAQDLKEQIKAEFGVKYALKSPAHVTVKMPFSFSEAKETVLLETLASFTQGAKPFKLTVKGVSRFGRRVIFWDVKAGAELVDFQAGLRTFCKRKLNLLDELADRNYHPHMTIAFKDLKERNFDEVYAKVAAQKPNEEFWVEDIWLLKRKEGRWFPHSPIQLHLEK